MQAAQWVCHEEKDAIAILALNRPHVHNALDVGMLQQLSQLLDEAKSSPSIKAVIMTGKGSSAFSAGADIHYLSKATPPQVRDFARLAVSVTHQIENLGKPVVAALNGYAYGGGLELAEACMIRIAAMSCRMGHPEVRIGAVAGFGGTTRLPRLVGKGRAAEMLLRGRIVDAAEALHIGLVQGVVEPTLLMQEAERVVRDILAQSPVAVRLTWEALHRGLNMTQEESAALGADYFGLAAATEDFQLGTRAFVEKRRPAYPSR